MNTPEEEALLIEAVTTAHREQLPDRIAYHPAWYDLGPEGRLSAFEAASILRKMEASIDPEGLSSSARAVLARIR